MTASPVRASDRSHVLIVEDNAANMELMAYLLEHGGFRVTRARDGEQALAGLGAERPDLVVCDVHLPQIDGRLLLPLLRQACGDRRLPVIAVTALAMIGDRDRLLAEGFDGYLSKPIEPQDFARQIRAFLGRADGEDSTPPA